MKAIRLFAIFVFSNLFAAFAQQPATKNTGATPFKLFFEKVYLHTDRELYSAGEDIWFKAYFVNAQSNVLTSTSNNLYVELISPDKKIVNHELVRLENGMGTGDFRLRESLPGGTYLLRAYTNWMRNYGDDFIFEKKLIVNNTQASTIAQMPGTGSVAGVSPSGQPELAFFPEGGSMVEGVANAVAFKAEMSGPAAKINGAVVSSAGDTITRFTSSKNGMGTFMLTPKIGFSYRAVGTNTSGKAFSVNMPVALPKGFAMHVTGTQSDSLQVAISTNQQQLSAYQNRDITIIVNHGAQTVFSKKIPLRNALTKTAIPTANLPAGVAAITLYDDEKKPHCERLVYIPGKNNIKVTVLPNKSVYRPKEKATITIKASDNNNKPVQANLSIAVVDNGIVPANNSSIESYLLLQSEIKGTIDNPGQYFDQANAGRFKDLDMLLLTQGWRDFVWRHLSDTSINISFMPEPGITISGKVQDKSGKDALANADVTLFANGAEGDKIFLTKTDAQGRFFFDGVKFFSGQGVRISATDAKGRASGRISVDSLISKPLAAQAFKPVDFPVDFAVFKTESASRLAEQKKQSILDTIQLKEVQLRNKNKAVVLRNGQVGIKFGYPDQSFVISTGDYDYKNLRHYLLTKVEGAMPDNSDEDGILFSSFKNKVRPRFIINRKEDVFQRLNYYDLPMDEINKVTVSHLIDAKTNDMYLIYLDLKPTAFETPNPGRITAQLNGYYQARTFYSPKYPASQPATRKDMRTTIFWQPNVRTDANGIATLTFFNADPKAKIRVVAEGITDKGIPVTGKAVYQVN